MAAVKSPIDVAPIALPEIRVAAYAHQQLRLSHCGASGRCRAFSARVGIGREGYSERRTRGFGPPFRLARSLALVTIAGFSFGPDHPLEIDRGGEKFRRRPIFDLSTPYSALRLKLFFGV
jgi:hypothetical protein